VRTRTNAQTWLAGAFIVICSTNFALLWVGGIVLAIALLLWPVFCPACGRLRLRDLPPGARNKALVGKAFITLILAVIMFSAYACLNALRELK
jgi:hypothetical protein